MFINIFGGITRCDVVATGILEALERVEATVPLVVRLDGTNAEEGRRILAEAAHPRIVAGGDDGRGGGRGRAAGGGGRVSVLVGAETRLVVQGITGIGGHLPHAAEPRVRHPGRRGRHARAKAGQDVEGIPVFDTVADAVRETGANTSMIFVPPRFAADAIVEAADAGVGLVVCITEGIPVRDMAEVHAYLRGTATTLVGPNCPGVITPGVANVGIIPGEVCTPGPRRAS